MVGSQILNNMVREGLTEEVTLEQSPEGNEASHEDCPGEQHCRQYMQG